MRRVMRFATVMAAALLLAACGGDGDSGGEGGGGTATLSTIDNAFQPASLTVSAGAELELTNDGEAEHNFSIEGTDVSQDVDPGESATVSVDVEAGDYTMFCEYHRAIGMEGTVTVQ
jgi:plastocyanin